MFNTLMGPFHVNLDQFVDYLKSDNELQINKQSIHFHWFLFRQEYFQIELGENQIEQDKLQVLHTYSLNDGHSNSWYKLKPIEKLNMAESCQFDRIYFKLPSEEGYHFHRRLPYQFQLFSLSTLQCTIQHLGISPSDYTQWNDKSVYIKQIEQIYDQNATDFNRKVLIKCGILLGYFDRSKKQLNYIFQFRNFDVVFDSSTSYSSRMTFLMDSILLIWFLIKFLVYIFHLTSQSKLFIHPAVKYQMQQYKINSLQILNDLIEDTSEENIYANRLFLVANIYLIILYIDLNEVHPYILRQFRTESPLTIIPIRTINAVSSNGITISYSLDFKLIPFSSILFHTKDNASKWLGERLMVISANYRYLTEGSKRLREENALYFQKVYNEVRRIAFIDEEKQRQRINYGVDLGRLWTRMPSASPEFIAQFRLMTHQIVKINNLEIVNTSCSVCLENFQPDQCYAQWPCKTQHMFHYACMLDVLRMRNICPLCHYAVDAAHFPSTKSIAQQIFIRILLDIII